jgi:hypothetical protein
MTPKKSTSSSGKPLTKAAIIQELAQTTSLSRQQVTSLLDALAEMAKRELGKKGGAGKFTVPGLLQMRLVRKKATKERLVPNPFKPGEMMTMKAKPAQNSVKVRALKAFSDELK